VDRVALVRSHPKEDNSGLVVTDELLRRQSQLNADLTTRVRVSILDYSECQNNVQIEVMFIACSGLLITSSKAAPKRSINLSTFLQTWLLNQLAFITSQILSIGGVYIR
jgi:hypothetical protein